MVPLRLAQHEGEKLVSRAQAKRVAHRFEKFKRVMLDFDGVTQIGQAFAERGLATRKRSRRSRCSASSARSTTLAEGS